MTDYCKLKAFREDVDDERDYEPRHDPQRLTCPTCGQAWESQCKICGIWTLGCRCGWIDDPCNCDDPVEEVPWEEEEENEPCP